MLSDVPGAGPAHRAAVLVAGDGRDGRNKLGSRHARNSVAAGHRDRSHRTHHQAWDRATVGIFRNWREDRQRNELGGCHARNGIAARHRRRGHGARDQARDRAAVGVTRPEATSRLRLRLVGRGGGAVAGVLACLACFETQHWMLHAGPHPAVARDDGQAREPWRTLQRGNAQFLFIPADQDLRRCLARHHLLEARLNPCIRGVNVCPSVR